MPGLALPQSRIRRGAIGLVRVTDSFTRPDSTTTMGRAETGQAWTALQKTWGISTNRAYNTGIDGNDGLVVLQTNRARSLDLRVTVAGVSAANYAGLAFRCDGTSQNYWRCFLTATNVILARIVGGSATNVLSVADATTSGVLRVLVRGSSIEVIVAGTSRGMVVDGAHLGRTWHGLYLANGGAAFLDDYRAEVS